MFTYAIPDLHGRLDLFDAAFKEIAKHAKASPYKVITLGDYIDRGPQSRQLIERLMELQRGGAPLICLKGNHEDMMVSSFNGRDPVSLWLRNGGIQTLESYGSDLTLGTLNRNDVPREHLEWMERLPSYYADDHRIYVHAGVMPGYPLSEQTDDIMLWMRYPDDWEGGLDGKYVVHGHTPQKAPRILEGRVNLDTKAWSTGVLHVGVFVDEGGGGPFDYLEVTAP